MSDIVIKAEHLSKYYRLGVINNGTLFKDIQSWWSLKHGKEDPHSKIGSNKYESSKDGFWALKDLNFEIKQGDRVGIIGKNGAGKSTLLKLLSRITAPTEGKIKIKGRVASLLEVGTGFHAELSGRENIYLNGAILGMKKREVDAKIDEIIAFSEIENHIDTPVKRYSSGMYVRLAFAVAAHLDSEILIADEVLAVGDVAFQKKALGKMNDLSAGQGRTVLFVSHNMSQVKNLCKKGIILDHGSLIREDDDITKSISYYLGTDKNGSDIVTTSWENNGSYHDPAFTPVSLEFLDEKNEIVTSALDYSKSYKIRLKAKIEKHENIDFGIIVCLGTEKVGDLSVNDIDTIKPGLVTVDFCIPAGTLLPNTYIFSLGSSLKRTSWIINPFTFDVSISTTVITTNKVIFPSKILC